MSYGNRVKETSTSTGTGNLTLAGAVVAFVTFNTAFGLNNFFHYFILHNTDNTWEAGIGRLSASTTFVRDTVLDNSSGGTSAIDFAAGGLTLIASPGAGSLYNAPMFPFNSPTSGQILRTMGRSRSFTTELAVADRAYGAPFITNVGKVITTVKIEITAAVASALGKFALYRLNQSGDAEGRIISCRTNTIDVSTTGLKTRTIDETSVYIPPGEYLGAFVFDDAITFRAAGSTAIGKGHWDGHDSTSTVHTRGLHASETFSTAFADLLGVTWIANSTIEGPEFILS